MFTGGPGPALGTDLQAGLPVFQGACCHCCPHLLRLLVLLWPWTPAGLRTAASVPTLTRRPGQQLALPTGTRADLSLPMCTLAPGTAPLCTRLLSSVPSDFTSSKIKWSRISRLWQESIKPSLVSLLSGPCMTVQGARPWSRSCSWTKWLPLALPTEHIVLYYSLTVWHLTLFTVCFPH